MFQRNKSNPILLHPQNEGKRIKDSKNYCQNNVVSKFPHRKNVKVLQLWHATGALIKFGNDVERDYIVNHYDYTIVNSDFLKPIFDEGKRIKDSKNYCQNN